MKQSHLSQVYTLHWWNILRNIYNTGGAVQNAVKWDSKIRRLRGGKGRGGVLDCVFGDSFWRGDAWVRTSRQPALKTESLTGKCTECIPKTRLLEAGSGTGVRRASGDGEQVTEPCDLRACSTFTALLVDSGFWILCGCKGQWGTVGGLEVGKQNQAHMSLLLTSSSGSSFLCPRAFLQITTSTWYFVLHRPSESLLGKQPPGHSCWGVFPGFPSSSLLAILGGD